MSHSFDHSDQRAQPPSTSQVKCWSESSSEARVTIRSLTSVAFLIEIAIECTVELPHLLSVGEIRTRLLSLCQIDAFNAEE